MLCNKSTMSGLKRAKSEQTDRKKIKSVADDSDVAYYRTLKSCFDKVNGNKDGTVPYKNAAIQLQIFLEDIGVDVSEDNCKKLLKASSNKSKVTFEEFLFCFETFLRNAQKAGVDVKLPTFAGLTRQNPSADNVVNGDAENKNEEHKKLPLDSLGHERAKSDHSGEEKKPKSARKAHRKSYYDAPSSPLHKDSDEDNPSLKRAKSKKDAKKDGSDDSKEEKEKRHHKKRKSSSGKLAANINSPRTDKSSPRKIDSARPADTARSEVDSFAMEEPRPVVENNTNKVNNNKEGDVKREPSNPTVKIDEKPVIIQPQNNNTSDSGPASVPSEEQPKSLRDSAIERLRSPSKTDVKVSPAFKRLEASLAESEEKDIKLTVDSSVAPIAASASNKSITSSTEETPAVSAEVKVETPTPTQPQPHPPQAHPPQAHQPKQPAQPKQSPANSRNNSTTTLLPKSNSSASINTNAIAPKSDDIAVNKAVSHVRKMSTNSNGTGPNSSGIQREDSVNITDMEGKAANVSVQIKQLEDDIKAKSDQLKVLKDQLVWQQEGITRAKERKQNRISALIQNIEFRAEESPSQSPNTSGEFNGKVPNFIKRTHTAQKSKRIKYPKVEFVNGKMYNIAQVLKCQAIVRNHLVRKRSFRPEWVLQWAESQGASKMRKRNNALKEIITTERDFVAHLNKVMEVFVRPIQKLQLLTPFELFEIFSDIEVIAALNQILLTKLEDRYKEWPKIATFADIFKENAELFTLYYRYIRNFTTARTKQQEAEGKYPHYTQFLKNCYERFTGGLDVYAYLIMPVQRIMRYELLLKALLDYTEETHVDYQNLRDAIAAVQKVNRYIDERKKIDEQMEICEQRFKDLIAKGGGYEVLLTQGNYAQRRFVKEFQLEAIIDLSDTEKGKKSEAKPELMIFSDLILASNFMHRKATLNEAGQSLPLVWIDTEFNKRNQKVIETIAAAGYTLGNGFLLNGPETSWFVKASNQSQMKELFEELAHALKIEVTEASALREGFRLGCWRFVRPISGFYDGEWMAGDFHGQGIFTSPEGRVFDGYWDHTLKAGYGNITEPSKEDPTQVRSIKSGWINEHTKGIPITALDSEGANFWNQTSELTDRDLHLLTLNAQDVVYERNEKIIEQDKESGTLFLVVEGSVRIEKTTSDGNSIRLAVMGAGTLLGDSSVLPALRKATASVVADVTTKLKAVSLPLVFELFKSDSILCARFYKHLAVKLSRRLRSLNSGGQAQPPKPAPPKGISSKLSSGALSLTDAQAAQTRGSPRASGSMEQIVGKAKEKEKGQKKKEKEPENDAAICEKFGLGAGEVFIKTTEVWVKQRGKRLGRLYISGHFVCFDFTVFGSHHKESIPILKIVSLEKDKEDNTAFKIKTKNKKFTFNIEANPLDDYYNLINSLWEQAKSAEESKALEERSVTKPSLNKKFTYQELGATSSMSLSTSGSIDSLPTSKSSANFGVGKTWDKLDMQEEDWNLILQGSKTITYRSGAVIIQAGTVPQRVFQIVQGKCRLEKKMPDGSVQSIGSINTGAMFGEMSFLEGETASISVVADSKVVVYVIEGYFLNILFVRYPNLAGRFFNYLSSVIATRVSKRESALRDESESEDSQSSEKFRRSTTRPIAANVFNQPNSNSPVGAVQRAESRRKQSLTSINEQNTN